MRRNLMQRMATGDPILPGIIGYDDTVIPEIENAVLAGHHIVFLGERGQGKSRIIRGLVGLLDPVVPAVDGCAINDDPLAPRCRACRRRLAGEGDALPVVWLERDLRYGEKLATPDVSMADLVGEVDPIKVAEGRYLADEETIHFGLIPRTNRGIFAINELPDLTEKVQVGLFNLMEEKDVQIKGYKVRLPLDVVIFASANPEDYTSRGRIITPLKDRFDVQIRTHYPRTLGEEIAIVEQEATGIDRAGLPTIVPQFLKEILAQLTMEARASNEINQASGVSVRVTINNYETLVSNAEKRALKTGEPEIVPRLTDLPSVAASTVGKVELEYGGEEKSDGDLIERLINRAVLKIWDKYLTLESCERIVAHFEAGWGVEVSDRMRADEYQEGLRQIPGLNEAVARLVGPVESPGLLAAATELVLEGLHLHQKLNRDREGGRMSYRA
jgi:magnesium chelatase subunit I